MSGQDEKPLAKAIRSLEQAHQAIAQWAGEDKLKKLYAEEMLDILRRLRGEDGS